MANYSLGEIDALARKATRGAGYSWGIAEEVGKAVRWLSAYGFSGAEALAKHLELLADQQQAFLPKLKNTSSEEILFASAESPNSTRNSICSLYCGTLINDLGHQLAANKSLSFSKVLFPLLALPSAGRIAGAYDISVSFVYGQTTIICDSTGIALNDTPPLLSGFSIEENADIVCSRTQSSNQSTNNNTHFPSPQSRSISKEALEILEKFAHKTYAPATEESRLRGAG